MQEHFHHVFSATSHNLHRCRPGYTLTVDSSSHLWYSLLRGDRGGSIEERVDEDTPMVPNSFELASLGLQLIYWSLELRASDSDYNIEATSG